MHRLNFGCGRLLNQQILCESACRLQATGSGGTGGGAVTVRMLELSTGAITLHCPAPGVEEHDLATTTGLQVSAGHALEA